MNEPASIRKAPSSADRIKFSEQRKTVARAQTFYRLRTSRTHPEIVTGFTLALGVGDQRRDQLQNVLFRVDVAVAQEVRARA